MEGVLTGMHRSPHHGSSIEFAEHKEYSPGDDVRHIDWRAYAKTDKFHVKQFEEETNLRGHILVDGSASMGYASHRETKYERAAMIAASLAYLLLRQQDSVGLTIFGEDVVRFLPPRTDLEYLQVLCDALEKVTPAGKTNLHKALAHVAETARKRSMVLIVSDFFDHDPKVLSLIRQLRYRKHDVVLFQVLDPWELSFPFDDITMFEGLEGEGAVLADPRAMQHQYVAEMKLFVEGLARECAAVDASCLLVNTEEPAHEALVRMLLMRDGSLSRRWKK